MPTSKPRLVDGVTVISDATIEALAQYQRGLGLSGLTSLSDAVAVAILRHQGRFLHLSHVTSLSDAAARALATYRGTLAPGKALSDISDAGINRSLNITAVWISTASPRFRTLLQLRCLATQARGCISTGSRHFLTRQPAPWRPTRAVSNSGDSEWKI